jgi:hypothetical protein
MTPNYMESIKRRYGECKYGRRTLARRVAASVGAALVMTKKDLLKIPK